LLRDMMARWNMLRRLRESPAFVPSRDPAMAALVNVPDIDLYAIDVSFKALKDPVEREYLNQLPTSFVLPPEAVDRLRQAAATIMRDSPEFKRLANDAKVRVVVPGEKAN
jgi:NTE family protein